MISIALATYNGEIYIREQLDSILSQTYQDFEIVICDDCSTDSTWEVLQEYRQKDERIRIYRNTTNVGFKKNFEKAISLCNGEFIALSDQDDIWISNHLELLYTNIERYSIVCGNSEIVDENGYSQNKTLKANMRFDRINFSDDKKPYRLLYFSSPYQGSAMLIKKDFFKTALPIPFESKSHDAWFAMVATFSGGIKYLDDIVLKYRRHENNVSGISKKKTICSTVFKAGREKDLFNDRKCFVREILSRVETLTDEQVEILNQALIYHEKKDRRLFRFKNIPFRIKYYKYIYSTDTYKLLIPRLIKFLL